MEVYEKTITGLGPPRSTQMRTVVQNIYIHNLQGGGGGGGGGWGWEAIAPPPPEAQKQ